MGKKMVAGCLPISKKKQVSPQPIDFFKIPFTQVYINIVMYVCVCVVDVVFLLFCALKKKHFMVDCFFLLISLSFLYIWDLKK
jgi:hypothetical protein